MLRNEAPQMVNGTSTDNSAGLSARAAAPAVPARRTAQYGALPRLALMAALSVAVMFLTVALAAANGANDVSKGIATLAGAGAARYRTAILWGTVTTLVGAVASMTIAERLSALFSRGIVTAPPTPPFAVAVLVGATAWVGFATATRLPVSTTQAIVGALREFGLAWTVTPVGAGLVSAFVLRLL